MSGLPGPAPATTPETLPFWESLREGRLVLPRCDRCREWIWYPRLFCPACGSVEVSWLEVAGTGTVYSFSRVRRGAPEAYAASIPYVVAIVELDEGPRLYTNVLETEVALCIGQPVQLVRELEGDVQVLPRFRPV